MLAVALMGLKTSADAEAPLLAKELGVTAFEAGQLLRGLFPSVVLKTDDAARAEALVATLVSRGHRAVRCDLGEVVRHTAMVFPRGFELDAARLTAVGQPDAVAFAEVRALIRATHVAQLETVKVEKGKQFSLGRAALTGGLMMTKGVEKETLVRSVEKDPVLYLFPQRGLPWLFRESALKYDGLGPKMKPGRPENFLTLTRTLKESATGVFFDERLINFRGALGAPNTPETIDLLAHLLARHGLG